MPKKTGKKPIVTRKQKIAAADPSEYSYSWGAGGRTNNANSAAEYLENPVTSDIDMNQYRVIKLGNGLTAVLVSSPEDTWCEDAALQTDESDKPEDRREDYALQQFEKLIDKELRDSAKVTCKLSINVGSFSDPPDAPCVSRILSRVIIESSKKYPQMDSFENFLIKYDGAVATSLDTCELTFFSFDVPAIRLHEALDRFTHCFTDPLLKRDAIWKERDIIEMEYEARRYFCFGWQERIFPLLASIKPSNVVLSEVRARQLFSKTAESLWDEVNKFMKRHYSANRMAVVLQAQLPLDSLEQYALKYFSRIPNNELPPIDLSHYSYDQCFDFPALNMLYEMGATSDGISRIEFHWPMPSPHGPRRSEPHRYISWLIQNDASGSLMNYLRNEKWCTRIKCSSRKTDFDVNMIYGLFSLYLDLTAEGKNNWKKIIDTVYSYVNFLKLNGVQKRTYDEIKRIHEARFRIDCTDEPLDYEDLCTNMHYYPSKNLLSTNILHHDYDPEAIKICLACISPDKANINLHGKSMIDWNSLPKNADTNFGDEPLDKGHKKVSMPKAWIEEWREIAPMPCFMLPEPNIFCPNDFTLVPAPRNSPRYPVKIHSDSQYEVWHKLDNELHVPETRVNLMLIGSVSFESVENAAMLDLLAAVLKQILNEKLYPATVVGMKYRINSCYSGIMIRTEGFSQKLPLLIQTVSTYIGNFSNYLSEKLLNAMKNRILEEYLNYYMSPEVQADDVRFSILRPFHRTIVEKHAAIIKINLEQFKSFVACYTQRIFIQSLVQGNIRASDALEIVRNFIRMSRCKLADSSAKPQQEMKAIPRAARCCRVQNLNPRVDVNHVTNYYQYGEKSIMRLAVLDLLVFMAQSYVFAALRLRENLDAYRVTIRRDASCLVGISFSVSNPVGVAGSIATAELEIEKFRRALGKLLRETSPNEWRRITKIYMRLKRRVRRRNVGDETERNWQEIRSREYIFDRHEREAEAIAGLGIDDLQKYLLSLTASGPNTRKLSIQIVGHAAEFEEENVQTNRKNIPYPNELKLKILTNSPECTGEKCNYYITDISAYRRTLRTVVGMKNECSVDEITSAIDSSCQLGG